MITEVARLEIKSGQVQQFLKDVQDGLKLFERVRGCRSVRLDRSVETPLRFWLIVGWATIEDHVVHFRQSTAIEEWRALVGPHLSGAPEMEHTLTVIPGFAVGTAHRS